MLEETANECLHGNGLSLFLSPVLSIRVGEGDVLVRKGQDSFVGDGDAVGVFREILDRIPIPVERLLD